MVRQAEIQLDFARGRFFARGVKPLDFPRFAQGAVRPRGADARTIGKLALAAATRGQRGTGEVSVAGGGGPGMTNKPNWAMRGGRREVLSRAAGGRGCQTNPICGVFRPTTRVAVKTKPILLRRRGRAGSTLPPSASWRFPLPPGAGRSPRAPVAGEGGPGMSNEPNLPPGEKAPRRHGGRRDVCKCNFNKGLSVALCGLRGSVVENRVGWHGVQTKPILRAAGRAKRIDGPAGDDRMDQKETAIPSTTVCKTHPRFGVLLKCESR